MQKLKSVDEILDFAIGEEEKAANFYSNLSEETSKPSMKKAFKEFVREEMKHKEKLLEVKKGKQLKPDEAKVADLKIADYSVDVKISPKMDYQDALTIAMKKEKAAYRMYSDLAETTGQKTLKNLFLKLAQEEAKHKLKFEVEYDEFVMQDN